ncbi:hypothetical protein EV122DRAFT_256010 [Schizophyllum commune]
MQFEADVALADFQSVIGSPYEQFQALPSAIQGKYIQAYPKLIWKIFGVPPKIKTAMRSAFQCIYKGVREVERMSDVIQEMRQSNAFMGLGSDVRDSMSGGVLRPDEGEDCKRAKRAIPPIFHFLGLPRPQNPFKFTERWQTLGWKLERRSGGDQPLSPTISPTLSAPEQVDVRILSSYTHEPKLNTRSAAGLPSIVRYIAHFAHLRQCSLGHSARRVQRSRQASGDIGNPSLGVALVRGPAPSNELPASAAMTAQNADPVESFNLSRAVPRHAHAHHSRRRGFLSLRDSTTHAKLPNRRRPAREYSVEISMEQRAWLVGSTEATRAKRRIGHGCTLQVVVSCWRAHAVGPAPLSCQCPFDIAEPPDSRSQGVLVANRDEMRCVGVSDCLYG